jgi:hypothetical protein
VTALSEVRVLLLRALAAQAQGNLDAKDVRALCESYRAASGPPARERGVHTLSAEETMAGGDAFAKLTDAVARVASQSNHPGDMRDLAIALALLQESESHA